MRISVDVGYGFTKAMNEEGKTAIFPSLVARNPKASFGFNNIKEDYEISLFEEDSEKAFFVGNSAMTAGAVRQWEEEASKNRNLHVLIATSIAQLTPAKVELVDIVVGLPMVFYQDQRKDLEKALESKKLVYQLEGSKKQSVTINSVFVFPQGAGAYYSTIYDIQGKVRNIDFTTKPIAIIDIGYRTTDYLFMTKSIKGIIPRQDMSGSIVDVGMNVAHKEIQGVLKNRVRKEVPIVEIEKALFWSGGQFINKGITIDLKTMQKQSYEELAQKIVAELKQKWGDDINRLAAIVVAGGGGDALYPYIVKELPAVIKAENPEFANAYGYLAAQAQAQTLQVINKG